MKRIYTLLAVASIALLNSCSSSHKVQDADDVYYSPGGKATTSSKTGNSGEYYSTAPSDNYVRMKSQDYDRWSTFDDYNAYDSYYAPASVGFSSGFGYGYPAY